MVNYVTDVASLVLINLFSRLNTSDKLGAVSHKVVKIKPQGLKLLDLQAATRLLFFQLKHRGFLVCPVKRATLL